MNSCNNCQSRICPNGHGLIIRSCDCCKSLLINTVVYSCVPCNFVLCGNCVHIHFNKCTPIKADVKIEVNTETKTEKNGFPCKQCGNNIVYNRVNPSVRVPKCTECKGSNFEHVYTCFTCNLDVCEGCCERVTKQLMQGMSNLMGPGKSGMGGFGNNQNVGPMNQNNQVPPQQKGGFSNMMNSFGFK